MGEIGAVNAGQALGIVLADELARCGVEHACLAPGSRSAPVALALASSGRIRLHVQIDERSAAFTALGIAKASGRPAVVLTTSGTAAANLHPAVLEARHSATPLLVLTADRPPELRDAGANQTVDQVKLFGDGVRLFVEVGVPEARPEAPAFWRSVVCRAHAAASGPVPGPVHLNLALREPLVPDPDAAGFPFPLEGRPGGEPWTRPVAGLQLPPDDEVRSLAAAVSSIPKGMVVLGDGAGDAGGVLALAEAAGWPVLADPLSGGRKGPAAVPFYEGLLRDGSFLDSHRPGAVLRVGRVAGSRTLAGLAAAAPVQIVASPRGEWDDPGRSAAVLYHCDAGLLCAGAAKFVEGHDGEWLDSWMTAGRLAAAAAGALLDSTDTPSEPRTARDLCAWLPPDSLLVAASSMPVREVEWFMAPRAGLRVIANRGASGIDGFVSTVLGAALAEGRCVFALAGDLSMLHDQSGFLLAADRRPDAVFVVLNNDGGAIFSFLPQARFPEHFERVFGTPHGVDFAKVAAVHGLGHQRLEGAADLGAALDRARSAGGVQLIEAVTDRSANVDLHRRIWAASSEALAGA